MIAIFRCTPAYILIVIIIIVCNFQKNSKCINKEQYLDASINNTIQNTDYIIRCDSFAISI